MAKLMEKIFLGEKVARTFDRREGEPPKYSRFNLERTNRQKKAQMLTYLNTEYYTFILTQNTYSQQNVPKTLSGQEKEREKGREKERD